MPQALAAELALPVASMVQFISARAPELSAPWLARAARAGIA